MPFLAILTGRGEHRSRMPNFPVCIRVSESACAYTDLWTLTSLANCWHVLQAIGYPFIVVS